MLSVDLSRASSVVTELFLKSQTAEDIAEVLEIPIGQLIFLLYKIPDNDRYSTFTIPKKNGGIREISSPIKGISILQKKLLSILEEIFIPKPFVHGFTNRRSILTNARKHKKRNYVLNIDLEDFFGSINFGRILGLFKSHPFKLGHKAATILAQLVTFKNALPQGASTSPIVSNMIAYGLDNKLASLAHNYHLTYTRYADDITFSTTKKTFPEELVSFEGRNPITNGIKIGSKLESIINSSGFKINLKKVRLQIPFIRQEVTGLTVNEFPNIERKFLRNFRAMIHAWEKYDLINAEKVYLEKYAYRKPQIEEDKLDGTYFKKVVYGKLSYIKMVRGDSDKVYINYCLKLAELDPNPPTQIQRAKEMHEFYDIFLCHASEDKELIVRPIYSALSSLGLNVFIDEEYIKWGDSFIEKINKALGKAKYVIAVLSSNSVEKAWPVKEINSSIAREIAGQQKLLPLMVGTDDEISEFHKKMPLIGDKKYLKWEGEVKTVVDEIKELLENKSENAHE